MKRPEESASAFIDKKVKEVGNWCGKTLGKARGIVHAAAGERASSADRRFCGPRLFSRYAGGASAR